MRNQAGTRQRPHRCNLHLRIDTWEHIAKIAQEEKYSISVLTEYLLRKYLGLDITGDLKTPVTVK